MPKLTVKWGREKLEVDANLNQPPLLLKSQLYTMTGVIPERQKILIKGKTLGDDDWNNLKLSDGAVIMMMGSCGDIPQAPTTAKQFVEDMTDAEVSAASCMPVGIKNLGNTCYLNATIQCLKLIRELVVALNIYTGDPSTVSSEIISGRGDRALTMMLRDLYRMLSDKRAKKQGFVVPINMVQTLHKVFPIFASVDERGEWMQQDANECWMELVGTVKSAFDSHDPPLPMIEQFMEGEFSIEMKNLECDDEPIVKSTETFLQLSCFLNQEVKYVQLGIKNKLKEVFEKRSEILGRDARYEKTQTIRRLPAYLCISMVRFFYKEKDKVNAKILKDVKFPLDLDVFDLCSTELQSKLFPMRNAFKDADERKLAETARAKLEGSDSSNIASRKAEERTDEKKYLRYDFVDDPGSNNSGFYELVGVVTHKGRSSSSGHYVAWVRIEKDRWAMCDDDEVHPVTTEHVLNLSGGGDWHCAYLLLYGPRKLEKQIES